MAHSPLGDSGFDPPRIAVHIKALGLGPAGEEDWALCLFWGSWPRRAWAAEPAVLGGSHVILGQISELLFLP